jgi:sulfur-oxidizing protein SoxX
MVRRSRAATVMTLLVAMLGTGCGYYSSFGFPVEEGNIEAGRQAFIDHGCHRCHSVAGVSLPVFPGAASPLLELGGPTSQVKAYSELVTSIINPSHRISERYREGLRQPVVGPLETQMPMAHIETMTVRQLIDLVAFLDSRYVLIEDYQYDFDDD